ncbi:MAG: EthD family reductase [Anaerolineae bacterium]|nr:EthD family reductase [Anaerolineae bacterium]MBN8618717.1 EthD family reductase [Anaerolineae bacterium]
MVKFIITFTRAENLDVFENAYNDLLALVERMPNIQRRQVVNVLGSPSGEAPYYRLLEIYFDSVEAMQEALRSKAGQEAGGELGRRFVAGTYAAYYADVFEEAGGSTPV